VVRGFNKVILMGNLARDPEVRYTANKQTVTRLTVAVGRQWKDKNGELKEQTDFIPVVVWGPQAEACERYLRKGRPVLVEGRFQVRNFETNTGDRRWVSEVVATSVVFLGSSARGEDLEPAPRRFERPQVGKVRDEGGLSEDFPLDFSEMPTEESGDDEADVPF